MKKTLILFLILMNLYGVSFPIDASSCSSSAYQLKNYADDLESKESEVESAESEVEYAKSSFELNCGAYGLFANDEYACGSWGTYRTAYKNALDDYDNAVNDYNTALSEVQYYLRRTLNDCQ